MSYPIYYSAGCPGGIPDHICDNCPDNDVENGRVRRAGFIHKSVLAGILVDPSDPAPWRAAQLDKLVISIPATTGTYDGGAPVEGPGYGDEVSRLVAYNHSVTFRDPNYKLNAPFYNAMKYSRDWYFYYCTDTQVHITGKPVKAYPKAPITDDITSEVVWETEVKWTEADIPAPADMPPATLDVCFTYTP